MKRQISILACLLMLVAIVFAVASCTKPEAPHVHDYVSVVTKAATCTEKGELTYTCECGDTYVDSFASKGHSVMILEAVAPTCTESGLTEGRKCHDCGLVTVPQSIIAPTGHKVGQAELGDNDCVPASICLNGCGKVFAPAEEHDYSTGTCKRCGYLPGSGTYDDPYVIATLTNYVANFSGGWDPVYYEYTATQSGWLTLHGSSAYELYIGTVADYSGMNSNQTAWPAEDSVTMFVLEGNTYYIGVAEFSSTEPSKVPFSLSLDPCEPDPFDHLVGTWSGSLEQYGWAAGDYEFTIDELGGGVIIEDGGWYQAEYVITSLIVLGDEVLISAYDEMSSYAINYTFVYDALENALVYDQGLSGYMVLTPGTAGGGEADENALVVGNNAINASDVNFTYVATGSCTLTLTLGNSIAGPVNATYTINGGVEYAIVSGGDAVTVTLAAGDELVVYVVAEGYATLIVESAGGSDEDENVVDRKEWFNYFEDSTEIETYTYVGNHDIYFDFTAEAYGIYFITRHADALVSGIEDYEWDETLSAYAFVLEKGATIKLNPWTTSPAEDVSYVYVLSFYSLEPVECAHENVEHYSAVEATCTVGGNIEHWYCEDCNKVWLDEALTEASSSADVIIDALGHTEGDEATCMDNQICTVCDEVLVAAEGHSFDNGVCSCGAMSIAYATTLNDGDEVKVTGTVYSLVAGGWNSNYKNISFYIIDESGNTLYIFRSTTQVAEGDVVTVTGKMGTYGGVRQVNNGSTAEIHANGEAYDAADVTIPEIADLKDGTKVAVSGTVHVIDYAWSDSSKTMSVVLIDADGNVIDVFKLYTKVSIGDIVTINGVKATHEGNAQIAEGASATVTGHDSEYDYVEMNIEQILAATKGTSVKVTGIVSYMYYSWSDQYKNCSPVIIDSTGKTLIVFQTGTNVAVGDIITVKGTVDAYNGVNQIGKGGITEIIGKHTCSEDTYVTVPAVAATCTESGKTEGTKCSECGKVITAQETIAALGHIDENNDKICDREDCKASIGGTETEPVTVKVVISQYADTNGWANETKYSTVKLDNNISVTATGSSNTGKYYTSNDTWRIYQTESGYITVTAANGKTIKSVKVTYIIEKGGVLLNGSTQISSGTVIDVNASSIKLTVGNKGTGTKGQVRITAIEVIYE